MFETTVTVVGNVLNPPDCRRLLESQTLVTHFKVAATSRRFDKADGRWIDGDSLRVRVNCWRQLAENVARSVNVGDPVIITGRLFSRDWEGSDHVKRVSYELDAFSVGHDLARGRAKFSRIKANTMTSAVDDELADNRIGEEPTAPAAEINGLPRRRSYDEELGGYVTLVEERNPFADDVLAELDAATDGPSPFDRPDAASSPFGVVNAASSPFDGVDIDLERELAEELASSSSPDASLPGASSPVPPDSSPDESEEAEEAADGEETDSGTGPAPRGRRRTRARVPAGV